MGWKDAPLVAAKGGKWQDAPLVGGDPETKPNAYDQFMSEAKGIHDKTKGDDLSDLERVVLGQKPKGDILDQVGDFSHAFTTGVVDGMTLGFGDEITAGIETPFRVVGDMFTGRGFDPGRAFGEALDGAQEYMASERDRNPVAAVAGDLTGSLATGGALAKGGFTLMNGAKSVPGMIARGAAEGAAYGGVSGFGRADGDIDARIEGARDGALWGAGTGGVVSGVAGALAARAANKAVPAVDELKDEARALYAQADASGVTFSQAEVKQVADDIAAMAMSEGIDPTLHPRATAALKRLIDAGATGMTVKNAQTIRRVLAAAGKDPLNPDEGRIVGQMVEKFDDMVAAKSPELAQARGIYHQAKKGELIEQTIELARMRAGQYGNGGMENALRTEFRALARKIVKGQLKGLSKEEIDAINKVAEGDTLENMLRWVGKFAPTGVVSSLSHSVPFTVGTALTGNPAIGAAAAGATMGAGIVGRSAAGAMTGANAVKAALIARNGGAAPSTALTGNRSAVLDALISAGGNQAAALPKRMPLEILVTGGNPAYAP